jgi:hypothetical protein
MTFNLPAMKIINLGFLLSILLQDRPNPLLMCFHYEFMLQENGNYLQILLNEIFCRTNQKVDPENPAAQVDFISFKIYTVIKRDSCGTK